MARKPKTRRCQPIDTKRLLKSPEVIKRATDLVQNSIGRRCDARTRGADGMRQVDLYRAKGHVGLQADLARLLELPLDQVKKQIPPLRMTTIRPGEEPWGPRYDPIARFLLGMSDEEPAAKKERDVAIPTPWGDCIIRAFDEVLQQTFQPHRSARAYRRGLQDPVHGILWEASKAVRGGARFWSVLDIKNFFPSMDHGHIRESLETQGFDSWFVDRLMALIQTQAIWDDGTVESITRGCQAGMRISGTIANLYLFELDQLVEKTFQARVHYSRYSDDILILATKRHEAVGAARLIRRWLKKHNHEVKGVSERMSADSLVH